MSGAVEVPVLILGGGPIGMSTALGLRHLGVECMLVERHPSTLDFPKGRRVTTRTVEIFRQWGLEGAVSEVSLTPGASLFVFEGETLLGPDFQRRAFPYDVTSPSSPVRELICSQERLEPVLRQRAREDGADLRFSTELSSFTQDESAVTAEIIADSGSITVRASYLVAADGIRGVTRESLGIRRSGPGRLGHRISVLVEADIEGMMTERQSAVYWLRQPRAGSLFVAVDNKRRWLCSLPYDPVTEPKESFTRDRCLDLVRGALGATHVELQYVGHRFWEPTALVADRYQMGRVFLAGDAAHVTTPEGGLGMNCGVADAHNLAWKLAGALAGWTGPALLTSYEPERRPHAVACVDASLGPARPPNPIDGLVLGQAYRSAVVKDDGPPAPSSPDPVGKYRPSEGPVIGHRISGSIRVARLSTCSARPSWRSPTRRANKRCGPLRKAPVRPEFLSMSTSSRPVAGTSSSESKQAAPCWSALTATWLRAPSDRHHPHRTSWPASASRPVAVGNSPASRPDLWPT